MKISVRVALLRFVFGTDCQVLVSPSPPALTSLVTLEDLIMRRETPDMKYIFDLLKIIMHPFLP